MKNPLEGMGFRDRDARKNTSSLTLPGILTLGLTLATGPLMAQGNGRPGPIPSPDYVFQRIATLPVVANTCLGLIGPAYEDCADEDTSAEIITVSEDGNLLVYTDGLSGNIGFIDITDPDLPDPRGVLAMPGDPTSVTVAGDFALVAVNTSADFVNTSGLLVIVDLRDGTIARQIALPGQPDSVAVSPDRAYGAVVIENERDEDLCISGTNAGTDDEDLCEAGGGEFGVPPQAPPGSLVRIVLDDLSDPATWTINGIVLTGLPDKFPGDPEPEYVDINTDNIAVVTLQENNYLVLVDLMTNDVTDHFTAGAADLFDIDTEENGVIELNSFLFDVVREPDGAAWIDTGLFATADEGDLDGGSRGFTIFDTFGGIAYTSGNSMDHVAARIGHYPEDRSENKGNETEGVAHGYYPSSGKDYLFAGSERSSFVGVYVLDQGIATFLQALPASTGPEGLLPIPGRDLFVSTGEEDDRGAYRGSITLYRLVRGYPTYPTVQSVDDKHGLPITFGALSALAADPQQADTVYSVSDSYYAEAAIFTMDVSGFPALITKKTVVRDGAAPAEDLDLEGIAARNGGFWLASEGAGSVDDPDRPVATLNRLLRVSPSGQIVRTIHLPDNVNELQRRWGFEGVAVVGAGNSEVLYVAFQREWVGDPDNHVRIGRYDVKRDEWSFIYYQKAEPASPNGGWTGLSEIFARDKHTLVVLERDNQGGPDARIKELRSFSIRDVEFRPQGEDFDVVARADQTLVRDLIPDILAANGYVIEKVEGATLTKHGAVIINTDNDGVEDHSGEIQQINLGPVL